MFKERLTMSREGEPSDMNRSEIEIEHDDAAGMNNLDGVLTTIASLDSSTDQSRKTD